MNISLPLLISIFAIIVILVFLGLIFFQMPERFNNVTFKYATQPWDLQDCITTCQEQGIVMPWFGGSNNGPIRDPYTWPSATFKVDDCIRSCYD
jgi:hypothetical protein